MKIIIILHEIYTVHLVDLLTVESLFFGFFEHSDHCDAKTL